DEVDYLVVSDGVFSKSKSLIEGKDYSPSYIGSKAFRITIPKDKVKVFDSNNINISMKPNAHLVIYPIDQKTCNVVMISRCNTALSKKLEDISFAKSFIKNTFNLSSEFDEYINDDLKHWSLYSSKNPVLPKINNVFYLGDAFYTFLPSMAQGAAQSIEAGKELFEILNNTNKNKSEEYFNQRAERTKQINSRSNFNYFAFHFSNTLFVYFRNLILKRLIKNSKFVDSYLGRVFRK
ncbi:MAG: salicylate 1-monooxygenase, partial [Pelagibacteraceae bacterium]